MPTGYTARLYDGKPTTFPQFAMDCARAFGALIDMRDEPFGAPIPEEIKPSPFYARVLAEAEARIAEVEGWDDDDAQAAALAAYQAEIAHHAEVRREAAERRERYEEMLATVRAWQPPTPEHDELRKFMIQQLESSIDFDCGTDWLRKPHLLAASAYRTQQLAVARDSEARARQHCGEEIARAAGRTEWVRALRASLGGAA